MEGDSGLGSLTVNLQCLFASVYPSSCPEELSTSPATPSLAFPLLVLHA